MLYFKGTNTGKGFITHEDHENFSIRIFAENVFVTDSGSLPEAWGVRNGLESITKKEAQTLVDDAMEVAAIEWDKLPDEEKEQLYFNERPESQPLPQY